MTAQNLKLTDIVNSSANDEEYSIPLDISDIINGKSYTYLFRLSSIPIIQTTRACNADSKQSIHAMCVCLSSIPLY